MSHEEQPLTTGSPRLEKAFNKYVQVWLWSILVTSAITETVSFMDVGGSKWGILGAGLLVISLIGSLSALGALVLLARFFGGYLLPVFFVSAEPDMEECRIAAERLKQGLRLVIFSLAMRMLLSAAQLALTIVIGNFGY